MRQLTINRTSWMDFRDVMEAHESFKTYGNLRGENHYVPAAGYLPEPYRTEFRERAGHINYTVVSYGTPVCVA